MADATSTAPEALPASGEATLTVTAPAGAPAPEAPEPKDDVPPEVRKALREANKEAEKLRLKLKEYEDRDKTEAQKLAERATAAEAAATEAQREIARLRVIAEVQLDPDLHEFVVGDTEDEMRAKAEKLKARAGAAAEPEAFAPGPRPDLSQGARSAMALNGDPLTQSVKNVLGIR